MLSFLLHSLDTDYYYSIWAKRSWAATINVLISLSLLFVPTFSFQKAMVMGSLSINILCSDVSVCCAQTGETLQTGTNEAAQASTQTNWKMVLHPVSTRTRIHSSAFIWSPECTMLTTKPMLFLFVHRLIERPNSSGSIEAMNWWRFCQCLFVTSAFLLSSLKLFPFWFPLQRKRTTTKQKLIA